MVLKFLVWRKLDWTSLILLLKPRFAAVFMEDVFTVSLEKLSVFTEGSFANFTASQRLAPKRTTLGLYVNGYFRMGNSLQLEATLCLLQAAMLWTHSHLNRLQLLTKSLSHFYSQKVNILVYWGIH